MSDLREALQRARGALADIANSDDMTLSLARKKARHVYDETTLSAEPAQEMTDEQISDCQVPGLAAGMPESILAFARNVIAADRASRLPEMGEGDWPALPEPFARWHDDNEDAGAWSRSDCDVFDAAQVRAAQVAAVEAYKALVRGET